MQSIPFEDFANQIWRLTGILWRMPLSVKTTSMRISFWRAIGRVICVDGIQFLRWEM